MEGFWQKYNSVLLDRAALKLHRDALAVQNKHLVQCLKRYVSSIPITEREVDYVPELLQFDEGEKRSAAPVVKTAVIKNENVKKASSVVTIEAAHIYKNLLY